MHILDISFKWRHTICAFCIWLLLLNMFSRVIHIIACISKKISICAEGTFSLPTFPSGHAAAYHLAHDCSGRLCQLPAQVVRGGLCGRRALAFGDSCLPPALAAQPASVLCKQAQLLQPQLWGTEPGSCTSR